MTDPQSTVPVSPNTLRDMGTTISDATSKAWDYLKPKLVSGASKVTTKVKDTIKNDEAFQTYQSHPHPEIDAANKAKRDKGTVITTDGTYKSLADLQAHGYGKDKKVQEYYKARELKDPNQASTPQLKLQAVTGKLSRLINNEQFRSLRDENKIKVLGLYYDRYVEPVFKINGIAPPSKDEWLSGYGNQKAKAKFSEKEKPTLTDEALHGATEGFAGATKVLGNVLKYTIGNGTTKLDQYYNNGQAPTRNSSTSKAIDKTIDSIFRFADNTDHIAQDYTATFATRHDPAAWLSNMGGHMIGEAPAYLTADGLGAPILGKIGVGLKGIVPSLAEKGAISTTFKVATAALKNAGEVFTVDKGENKSNREALVDAATAGVLTPLFHVFHAGGAFIVNQLKWAAAKLANGGKPFTRTIAEAADMTEHKEAERNPESMTDSDRKQPLALVNEADPDFKKAVKSEQSMREQLAREAHPEKASASPDKSIWRNLSTKQRQAIKDHISATSDKVAELMPLISPELQTAANAVEFHSWATSSSSTAQALNTVEKLTGLKVSEMITKAQAKEVGTKTGFDSPAAKLEDSLHEVPESTTEEFEPKEGANASLSPEYRVSYRNSNPRLTIAQLSSPKISSEDFINGTIKYLEDNPNTKSGKVFFEHPAHHLLQIAENSKAPAPIKAKALKVLNKEFDITKTDAHKYAGWLDYHVSKLKDSGRFDSGREGHVFRSTKLTPARYGTKWQKQLVPEIVQSEAKVTDKLLKKLDPKVAASTRALSKNLTILAERSQTSARALSRRKVRKNIHTDLGDLN